MMHRHTTFHRPLGAPAPSAPASARLAPSPPDFRLDQGLDRITEISDKPLQLPGGRLSPASDARPLRALDQLFAADTLDAWLDASLRPKGLHPELLLSGPFGDALGGLGQQLRQALEAERAEGSERQRCLKRAAQVLHEHAVLQDLAWAHRHALHQA